MKKIVGFLLVLSVIFAGCSGSGGDASPPPDQTFTLPTPPDPAPLPEGTAEAQAAYFSDLLELPDSRLAGWLGVYDALGVPVVGQDGLPVGSTGDDPVGLYFWQVWYASGLDLGGQGLPLTDAGSQLAASLEEEDPAAIAAIGPLLLADLISAAGSEDPQVRLLGQFVRERVLRGPSHVDILTPDITAEEVVIDLPTVQLINWVAMRGVLFQEGQVAAAARPASAGRVSPKNLIQRAQAAESAGTTCQDLSNNYTGWANWLLNKFGGGLELPGMTEALPSFTGLIQKKLGDSAELIEKTGKIIGYLNLGTTAITAGLQYLAMEYKGTQSPDPLTRNYKPFSYDDPNPEGFPGTITLLVEYNPELIPNGNDLKYCFQSFLLNGFGISFSFPQKGPISKTEIFVEAGQGIPAYVLFDPKNSDMKINRVTTGEDGQATIAVLGRTLARPVPACASPGIQEFSLIVSAQPEEVSLTSMISIFFDGLGGPKGLPGAMLGALKTAHWKETEIFFSVQDWSATAYCLTTDPVDGETDVDVYTSLQVWFSEAMDASTITSGTFVLKGASGEIAYDSYNRMAIFTPWHRLSYSTTYTATLTTGIKTAEGASNAEDYTWSFTTRDYSYQGSPDYRTLPRTYGADQPLGW